MLSASPPTGDAVRAGDVQTAAQRLQQLEARCRSTGAVDLDVTEIERIQTALPALEDGKRKSLGRVALLPASLCHSYLRLAGTLRTGSRVLGLEWYTAAVLTGAVLFVPVLFLTLVFTHSLLPVAVAGASALGLGSGLAFCCLLIPSDRDFHQATKLDLEIQELRGRLRRLRHLARLLADYDRARQQYNAILQRFQSRRNQLLVSDWRSLRGIEFESFLAEVFGVLGYSVETTKASGDQGIDLIVAKDGRRIGVQAKGYANSVGNAAVQEAFAGQRYYRCQHCVVITNSTFTRGAYDLARSTGCQLVDGDQIPGLISGRLF